MSASKRSKKTIGPKYVVHYWNMKGRAEAIRLTLVCAGLEFTEAYLDDEAEAEGKKNAGTATSPFGQWPMLSEDDIVLCQSHAIIKHIGRQHGMYGSRNKMEDYLADCVMVGADALGGKFSDMVWVHGNTAEAKTTFERNHLDTASKTGQCGGAHLAYFEGFLERSETEWVAGGKKVSVADIVLFSLYDSISVVFENVAGLYPKCAVHHKKVSEIEAVAEYLKSDKRHKN